MPLLFAGGVCCAVLVLVEGAGLLEVAALAAGLLAGALLASGVRDGLLAGVELAAGAPAGAAGGESAAVVFLDLLSLVVVASALARAAPPAVAELSLSSALVLFFDRGCFVGFAESLPPLAAASVLDAELSAVTLFFEPDFFGVAAESPLFAEESAAAVLLSVASAAVLFFERDFFVVVAVELSEAAASALSAVFFLDLEVVPLVESAVAPGLVCEPSLAPGFFLLFFLAVALLSA
jgi:hypothetical protein